MIKPSSRVAGLLALTLALSSVEGRPAFYVKDATPSLPSDPNTISTCTWWWDNVDGEIACEDMPFEWGITMEDFLLWNPSITADCGNYLTGQSYCVEAPAGGSEPPPTTTTTTPTEPEPTGGNGVETPLPTQPGMVDNCNAFYYVEAGNSCVSIAALNDITTAQLIEWNPSVGSNCAGLWAEVYVCVGLIGGPTPGPTPTTTTTTAPGNGIPTPTPTQPGMIDNCNAFYLVEAGDSCAAIAAEHNISQTQFRNWNPSVGTDCGGLWADVYVCVGVLGSTPAPTTTTTTTAPGPTTPPNGIETPLPTQPGMVSNCDAFHLVQQGETCASISARYGITQAQFITWNPTVGASCTGIWADAYVCVSIIGHAPNPTTTTTTAPPATTTGAGLSPTQSGIVNTCTAFYRATNGDTCQSIAQQKYPYINSIPLFTRWNPAVGSNCNNLLPGYYYCVATELHQPMPGIIDSCRRYYQVKAGDSCWAIQEQYGMTAAQFNRWNPLVGSDCGSLWVRYFVCVAV
ncbi:hypothetical protein BJY04DRAFT_224793 [Aspergillus karnatakaensis]|uniref:uncharacterized protein n=1 Tax=Aspergillus karnatakaensis TaxID=1810916 RepID=UPI003CCE1594